MLKPLTKLRLLSFFLTEIICFFSEYINSSSTIINQLWHWTMNYTYAPVNTIGTIGIPFESKQTILGHITQLSIAIFMLLWFRNKNKTLDKKDYPPRRYRVHFENALKMMVHFQIIWNWKGLSWYSGTTFSYTKHCLVRLWFT